MRKQRMCEDASYLALLVLLLWFKFSHSSVHEVYEVLRDFCETKNLFPRVQAKKGWATSLTAIYEAKTSGGRAKYELSLVWMFPRSSGSVNNWFILENPFYDATCSPAGTFREPIVVLVSCECFAYSITPIWLPCVCELSAWSALEIIWHVHRIYFDLSS